MNWNIFKMPLFSRARTKRFLARKRLQSSTELQPKETFPAGIKTLCNPDGGAIEWVSPLVEKPL